MARPRLKIEFGYTTCPLSFKEGVITDSLEAAHPLILLSDAGGGPFVTSILLKNPKASRENACHGVLSVD